MWLLHSNTYEYFQCGRKHARTSLDGRRVRWPYWATLRQLQCTSLDFEADERATEGFPVADWANSQLLDPIRFFCSLTDHDRLNGSIWSGTFTYWNRGARHVHVHESLRTADSSLVQQAIVPSSGAQHFRKLDAGLPELLTRC